MAHAGEALLKSVHESMMKYTWTVYPPTIRLEIAQQVGNAGVIGAALSAKSYYAHLHPSISLSRHEDSSQSINNQSITPSVFTRDITLLGSITTGLMFLYFSTNNSPSPIQTPSTSTSVKSIFMFTHAVFVGLHVFQLLSSKR